MSTEMIAATGNEQKMVEIRQILASSGLHLITMKEAGLDIEIVEDGSTFEENALLKARVVARASGKMAIADDSGLVVDAMGGEPGIHSARWMGHDTSYDIKNMNIIERLEGVPDEKRTARFVCAMAAVFPPGAAHMSAAVMPASAPSVSAQSTDA